MLTVAEKIAFIFILVLSLGVSSITFGRMFRVIGRSVEPLNWKKVLTRWPRGFYVFISQSTLFKTRPWIGVVHALVAWGFTLYMLVNVIDILYGMIPGFEFFPHHWIGFLYRLFVDVFSTLVLLGILVFLVRRFVVGDARLKIPKPVLLTETARKGIRIDSLIVGLFILFHVGSRLLGAAVDTAMAGTDWSQPFATLLGGLWAGFSPTSLTLWHHVFWWLALGLILAFLPYFPYSKHAHLFMGPLNHMAATDGESWTTLEKMDLEDESVEQFGVSLIEQLPQKELLDGYACIMCNRCQDACPATITGKELSPAALEVNKRYYFNQNLSDLAQGKASETPVTQWMLSEEAVWSCTTCGFCVEACPVGNEPMVDILRIRQDLVLMESRFPQEAIDRFNKMETYGNPWGMAREDRELWTEGLDVPVMREKQSAEYLYWAGCAGAYDDRGKDISRAVVKILNEAGVDFAILGTEESCTGDSARRMGNEYLFQILAEQNMETFKKYRIRKIITQCPHCLTTLKNDYRKLGVELEVIHHSQLIARLLKEGKLKPTQSLNQNVTVHDPCYLGRHMGEFDAPRAVLESVLGKGGQMVEMERSKNKSFCCGAGGGNMWYEIKTGKRINVERFEEAISVKANTVATACNFCMIMMEDARKVTGQDETMRVYDIAELIADRL